MPVLPEKVTECFWSILPDVFYNKFTLVESHLQTMSMKAFSVDVEILGCSLKAAGHTGRNPTVRFHRKET